MEKKASRYKQKKSAYLEIKYKLVYDITGKLVETLVNKALPSGSHAVTWDPKNLSAGLYIVQLKVGNKTFDQKLTFLK